ncbi:tRNA pseudouridine(38-40) synthase TruA [Albimonas pacifica]|uniref:tRNA pseudouridine synthase A n=1 Tax=Albimonas pacifica TaxID=1114924 RepID=A0A1I3LSX6_9RHOB|nr:tRNA pseudouridine(38-40) synthase TruA [Albimonas pacifica]SFI87783.1 tRNA pseudouridine38-40 synthase [Albimonas pacifica]
MPRYKLTVEYDGGPFAGWQRQADQPSVQEAIETALRRLEPEAPGIGGAGRTDAGVHATGQVCHCDMAKDWAPFRLAEAVNWHLKPAPVAVIGAERVADDFHARFDAVERRYTYRVAVRRAPLTLSKGLAWRVPGPLDLAAMREAAGRLVGRHDFTTFRSTLCQAKSPVKTLDALEVEATAEGVAFHLRARSFLHNQVRSLVGTLERVGAGAWTPERVQEALEARDRAACGPVAPPDGLYLTRVIYPDA